MYLFASVSSVSRRNRQPFSCIQRGCSISAPSLAEFLNVLQVELSHRKGLLPQFFVERCAHCPNALLDRFVCRILAKIVVLLASNGKRVGEARRIGRLAGVPAASEELQRNDPRLARLFPQVTAADLSPDRTILAVLTYGSVLFYRRDGDKTWADAVASPPEVHDVPLIPQAEALAWSSGGGGLYATGEFSPAPIFHVIP